MVVRKEQLMISVMGPSTTCRESLNTLALIVDHFRQGPRATLVTLNLLICVFFQRR